MSAKNTITLGMIAQELRGGRFRQELATSWSTALLYRVPGIPLVWCLARTGTSPTMVSLAALIVAVSLPLQALYVSPGWAGVSIAISGAAFQILDCTDGMLARVTGRTSKTGADLDFLIDMAQWGLLYLALGILADRILDVSGIWAGIAASAAWIRLFSRVVRDRLKAGHKPAPVTTFTRARFPVIFIAGLSGIIPLLALAGGWLWLMVLFVLAYSVLDVLDALGPLINRRS